MLIQNQVLKKEMYISLRELELSLFVYNITTVCEFELFLFEHMAESSGYWRVACTIEPFGVLLGADFLLVVGVDPIDDGIPLCTVHGGGADVIPLAGNDPGRVVVRAEWTESFSISDRLAYICQIIGL